MTSAATVLGHMPLVFVTGPGAQARICIGIVLGAGMGIGTLFTLFVVPSVNVLIAGTHTKQEESALAPEHKLSHKEWWLRDV